MLEENTLCGKYRLERRIAEGGFGEVWLVRHVELPKRYAAKFILDPACAAYLRKEGDLLCSLEHPNVVLVVDAEFQAERPFLVVEYVTGGSLRDRLARGPIPLAEALGIARTILEVLVFAHAKGIVHRDLKPENILFDDRGQVKVCDFGLGKVLASQATSLLLSGAQTTTSGGIVGTPAYMSPEQLAGLPPGPRNDLFSWGVILFEMLLGKRPSEFGHVVKWPTTASVPDATAELDRLLERSLCEVGERFQSASEALCALEALAPRPSPDAAEPPPSRRIVWHRLNPRYMEWLLPRVCPTEVLIEHERIAVPDAGLLARDGCVMGHVGGGVPLARVSTRGLLVSGHHDVLRHWLLRASENKRASWGTFNKALYQLLVEGAADAALATTRQATEERLTRRDYLVKHLMAALGQCPELRPSLSAGECLDRCLLLAIALSRPNEARNYLQHAEPKDYWLGPSVDHIRAWKEVFGDDVNARRYIEQAEAGANGSRAWRHAPRVGRRSGTTTPTPGDASSRPRPRRTMLATGGGAPRVGRRS